MRVPRPLVLPVVLIGFLLGPLPGCRHVRKTPAQKGEGVFLRSCAGCHGPDARGSHPPGFTVAPRDLTDPELQARLDDAALRETIHFGKGRMPAFGAALMDDDVTNLISYLRTLRRAK